MYSVPQMGTTKPSHAAAATLIPRSIVWGPAIWMNAATLEKYRPEMRKYYYDPTKYKTYLDQLGLKYPTVKPATSQ